LLWATFQDRSGTINLQEFRQDCVGATFNAKPTLEPRYLQTLEPLLQVQRKPHAAEIVDSGMFSLVSCSFLLALGMRAFSFFWSKSTQMILQAQGVCES
jgi:hypothetical protein